jgi:hypothetical protein
MTLTKMCSGAQRCGYCEDSLADEVEHIKPKDLYPEEVFRWRNYLYACGPCNGPKNNQYAVFSVNTGTLTLVTRRRRQRVTKPEPGSDVLLNPRREDSLRFMEINLLDTFFFLPIGAAGSRDYQRADYTIKVLRLNDRDPLPKAREEAYRSYRARLVEFIERRDDGATPKELNDLAKAIKRMGHPAVWYEMKRKAQRISTLADLFNRAPEAMEW